MSIDLFTNCYEILDSRNIVGYASFMFSFTLITCGDKKNKPTQSGIRIVKTGLDHPWEIIWGKDNQIWMTERDGRVSSIDPANGNTLFSYPISDVDSRGEGGLLGMALDPVFDKNGFIYVVYNYRESGDYSEKLVRFTRSGNSLTEPKILLKGIQAAGIHNGSRLWISDEANPKLYITTGDAANQSLPQKTNTLNGKVLRLNLDGTIPSDNPFPNNPVWSYGHRNAQGLVVANGIMYSSEHGPTHEDEINIIEKARNYGWPEVMGPCDGSSRSFCNTQRVKDPIWSSGGGTIAVCGLDYYNHNLIPEWKNSLIMLTLKDASIRQLRLSEDGKTITGNKTWFDGKWGRLRDLCVSPDGKVYVGTSNGGNRDQIIEISSLR